MRARRNGFRSGSALLSLAMLGACATTGDPHRGGLFGWSETKARNRQQELARRDDEARTQVAGEHARNAGLRVRHEALDAQARQLREELERLGAENRALDARLRTLMAHHALDIDAKRRLEALLEDNRRWLAGTATPIADGDVATQRLVVEQASQRNGALHRELLALLQH